MLGYVRLGMIDASRVGESARAGRQQRPPGGVGKVQIKAGHAQTAIGIPSSAGADGEQSVGFFRQHIAAVSELQSNSLASFESVWKDHRDHVIPLARQLRTRDGGIVNEL